MLFNIGSIVTTLDGIWCGFIIGYDFCDDGRLYLVKWLNNHKTNVSLERWITIKEV